MMRRNLLCRFGVAGCLALAAGWGILTLSGTALADKADADGKHHHGGGGDEEEETVFFSVTTPDPQSAIQIIGVFDSAGMFQTPTGCMVKLGPAAGGTNKIQTRVVVSRPSPAIQMDFLAALPECFLVDDIYGLACGGLLNITQESGSQSIKYFFAARGTEGDEVRQYRVDGDAVIVPDDDGFGDGSFPTGARGYTVFVDNIRVSRNTGSRRTACEGSFPDAMAVIRLDRIIP